jgi:hypothetical protein
MVGIAILIGTWTHLRSFKYFAERVGAKALVLVDALITKNDPRSGQR